MFDPLNSGVFLYLIVVLIRKATSATSTFLDEILEAFGKVVNHEMEIGEEPFSIAALIVTTRQSFERQAVIEFNNGKTVSYNLAFFRPFARCPTCFTLDHVAKDYVVSRKHIGAFSITRDLSTTNMNVD